MFVYDFKFDDLSKLVYNTWLEHGSKYPVARKFFIINFDDLSRSHRCNPLDHETIVTDYIKEELPKVEKAHKSEAQSAMIDFNGLPPL